MANTTELLSIPSRFITDIIFEKSLLIVPPLILFPGLIGNILVVVVLQRKELGFMPSAPYLVALAVADSCCLITGLLDIWLGFGYGMNFYGNPVTCKLVRYILYVSVMTSSWCVVTVSIDRFLCVQFPFRARNIRTRHRIFVIVCVVTYFFALNLHYLIFPYYGYSDKENKFTCIQYTTPGYRYFHKFVWPWIDFSMTFAAPFCLIVMCNVGMVRQLTGQKSFTEMDESTANQQESSRKLIRLLIILSVVFVVTNVPVAVVILWSGMTVAYDDPKMLSLSYCLLLLTQYLSYINNAINFLLYCIAGDRFRVALKALFHCRPCA